MLSADSGQTVGRLPLQKLRDSNISRNAGELMQGMRELNMGKSLEAPS